MESAVLVKEGFSWPALLLGPLWSLYRRLWAATLVWFAALVLLTSASYLWPAADDWFGGAWTGFGLRFGGEANDRRRRKLARRGWREAGIVGGSGQDAAVRRFADLSSLGRA